MKKYSIAILVFVIHSVSFAQISSGKQGEGEKLFKRKKEKIEKVKKPKEKYVPNGGIGDFSVFIGVSPNINSHKLEQNSTIFGKPVGIRADEKVLNTVSYGLGIRNRISQYFSFELGLSFDSYQVSYEGPIPTAGVDGKYFRDIKTLSMPILGYFTYGKKRIQFLAGAGVSPFMPIKKSVETTLNLSSGPFFQREQSMNGVNSFGFGVVFSTGVQYRFWRYGSLYFMPAYTMNLSNFYGKQEPHKEWYNAINFRFGIMVNFPSKEAAKTEK